MPKAAKKRGNDGDPGPSGSKKKIIQAEAPPNKKITGLESILILEEILPYLELKDKKNLRCVSRSLALETIHLEAALQKWTIHLSSEDAATFDRLMQSAADREMNQLKHFKLYLTLDWESGGCQSKFKNFLESWKVHVKGLNLICPDEIYGLDDLTFPALESLRLSCPSEHYAYMKDNDVAQACAESAIVELLNKYAGTLKSLNVHTIFPLFCTKFTKAAAPNLDKLSFFFHKSQLSRNRGNADLHISPYLMYGNNISVLNLGSFDLGRCGDGGVMPNLQELHLSATSEANLAFLSRNAGTVTRLVITEADRDRGGRKIVPTDLPVLTALVLVSDKSSWLMDDLLAKSVATLQHLVLPCMPKFQLFKDHSLPKLQTLWLLVGNSRLNPWFDRAIAQLINNPRNLPCLQQVNVRRAYSHQLEPGLLQTFKASYPGASITCRTENLPWWILVRKLAFLKINQK